MSKRKQPQKSISDFFTSKRRVENEADDENEDGQSVSNSTSNNDPKPSKPNHNFQFTFRMERVECANENNQMFHFDFLFHLSDTSTNQSDLEIENNRGLVPDSMVNIHVEGTAQENVEIQVKVGDNRKHKYN